MASAKKLPSGKWRVQVYLGKDENGKSVMKSFTALTRWDAERAADEFVDKLKKQKNSFTVGQALDGYINMKQNILSPATLRGYLNIRKNHFHSVMNIDIHELDSFAMQQAINEEAATKSRKTITEAKNLIVTALKLYGVHLDLNVTLPAKKPKIKELPTAEQVIHMIRGTDIELPCMLAMWLSLRISEVRGLQFRDLQGDVLTIQRSKLYLGGTDVVRDVNKTFNSTRKLVVPGYLLEMINAVPHDSETDFIVPQNYQYIKKHLNKLARENCFELSFHDLRHLNASVMLMLGIPDKYAMERGGWSTPNTLKAVYQHTFSEQRRQVDAKIDNYFYGILDQTEKSTETEG